MVLYCFTLPHIPPAGAGKKMSFRDVIGIDAFAKLKSGPFIVFIISLLLISVPFAAYFSYVPVFLQSAHIANPAFKMTFGQMSEILFLLMTALVLCTVRTQMGFADRHAGVGLPLCLICLGGTRCHRLDDHGWHRFTRLL